jgi:hypothetical protein
MDEDILITVYRNDDDRLEMSLVAANGAAQIIPVRLGIPLRLNFTGLPLGTVIDSITRNEDSDARQ